MVGGFQHSRIALQEGVALRSVGAEGGSRREHSVASPGQAGHRGIEEGGGLGGGIACGVARTEASPPRP